MALRLLLCIIMIMHSFVFHFFKLEHITYYKEKNQNSWNRRACTDTISVIVELFNVCGTHTELIQSEEVRLCRLQNSAKYEHRRNVLVLCSLKMQFFLFRALTFKLACTTASLSKTEGVYSSMKRQEDIWLSCEIGCFIFANWHKYNESGVVIYAFTEAYTQRSIEHNHRHRDLDRLKCSNLTETSTQARSVGMSV